MHHDSREYVIGKDEHARLDRAGWGRGDKDSLTGDVRCHRLAWHNPTDSAPTCVTLGAKHGARLVSERRELYRSPNGDSWFLGREPTSGEAFIIHQPNGPSGGQLSHIDLAKFLENRADRKPEQRALLRLIGTLVEVPPYADRT